MENQQKINELRTNKLYKIMGLAPWLLMMAIIWEGLFYANQGDADWEFRGFHPFIILAVVVFFLASFWAFKIGDRGRLGFQLIVGTSIVVFFQILGVILFFLFYNNHGFSLLFSLILWITLSAATMIILALVALPGFLLSILQWKSKKIKFSGLILQWIILIFPLTQIVGVIGIMFNESFVPEKRKEPIPHPSMMISLIVVKIFLSIGVIPLFFLFDELVPLDAKIEMLPSPIILDILMHGFATPIFLSHFILFFFMVFINIWLQLRGGIPAGETILRVVGEFIYGIQIFAEIGLLIRLCSEVEGETTVSPSPQVPSERLI